MWGWAMYDPLISWDQQGNMIGCVAESFDLSADGKTWTFKIRKGIKFSNGDPLTSADVAFSVERFSGKDSTNPWSGYLRNNFAGMATPDEYTFIYKAVTPEPALTIPFAWTRILPKNYIQKVGTDAFRKAPIGSGPFTLGKFVSKTSCELIAVKNHWRVTPAFEKVIDNMVPEEATRIAMLKRGDVDIIVGLSTDRLVELKDAGFKLQTFGEDTVGSISFQGTWLTTGPTKDKAFRQAMSYAINRQELCDTLYKGLAKPGGRWFMTPTSWGWDPAWQVDPYDPEKAKALLKEVNYNGAEVTLIATAGQYADMMQALQGYWDALGIKTKIKIVDAGQGYGNLMFVRNNDPKGDNVGDVIPWIYGSFFKSVYHCANMYKSTGVHSTGNDPQADVLYDNAVKELDPVKAKQLWTEFQNYGKEMWVNVGMMMMPSYFVVGPNVGKVTDKSWVSFYDSWAYIQHP
jgi:peptide/nickel transport system substrate-binding protein